MIWVRIVVGCLVDGVALKPGTLVQVSATDGQLLIGMGRAVEAASLPETAELPAAETATVPTAKTKITRRRRKAPSKK